MTSSHSFPLTGQDRLDLDKGLSQCTLGQDGTRPSLHLTHWCAPGHFRKVPRCRLARLMEPRGQRTCGQLWRWQGYAVERESQGWMGLCERCYQLIADNVRRTTYTTSQSADCNYCDNFFLDLISPFYQCEAEVAIPSVGLLTGGGTGFALLARTLRGSFLILCNIMDICGDPMRPVRFSSIAM